jgi:PleD family two-component response regulator
MSKILVIDQDKKVRSSVRRLLKDDYQVFDAAGIIETSAAIAGNALDLILVEPDKAQHDWDEITQHLSQNRRYNSYKVVLFSSIDERELRIKAKALGADGYIQKTNDPIILRARIARYIRVH